MSVDQFQYVSDIQSWCLICSKVSFRGFNAGGILTNPPISKNCQCGLLQSTRPHIRVFEGDEKWSNSKTGKVSDFNKGVMNCEIVTPVTTASWYGTHSALLDNLWGKSTDSLIDWLTSFKDVYVYGFYWQLCIRFNTCKVTVHQLADKIQTTCHWHWVMHNVFCHRFICVWIQYTSLVAIEYPRCCIKLDPVYLIYNT